MSDQYRVVLLVEQALDLADARQVRSLHEALEDPVAYHVLLPLEDAAARIEAAMGAISSGEMLAAPAMGMSDVDLDAVRRDCQERSEAELAHTLEALHACGAQAQGEVISGEPIEALADAVARIDAQEAIILTRPHVVAQFFHVDWTSRARRRLGVPILHLLEHENFDEQAGGGEGVSGI